MTKPTYEVCLAFIENELGIQLLDCQKDLLKQTLESETYYFLPSRFYGRRLYLENLKLLSELLIKENENE